MKKIMDIVKCHVQDNVSQDNEIPDNKKAETVDTVTSSIMNNLKKYATPANLSSLTSMFNGNAPDDKEKDKINGIKNNMESDIVSNLVSKVGLSGNTASNFASGIVPMLISLFSNKIKNSDSNFNIGNFFSHLSDKNGDSDKKNSVMDMVGNLFEK